MKALKRIAHYAGLVAFGIMSVAFFEVILAFNPKWMAWVFWIALGIWVVASSIRDGVKWYRKKIKPMAQKMNEVMDHTAGLTSRENEH